MEAPVFTRKSDLKGHLGTFALDRVVLANGCFDPLGVGHVRYLAAARDRGDCLVVAVHDDASTAALKGAGHPIMAARDRARLVAGMNVVDAVLILDATDVGGVLEAIKPACYARREDALTKSAPAGTETVTIRDLEGTASSRIIDRMQRP